MQPQKNCPRNSKYLKADFVETTYHFLVLISYVVFFPLNILFLTLTGVLGLAHLAALQALLSNRYINWLEKLTNRRGLRVLLFDAVEFLILIALAFGFYPFMKIPI